MPLKITKGPRLYLFRGQWQTIRQIADALGLSTIAVRDRIEGDTVRDIPRMTAGRKCVVYHFRGEQLTVAEICKITGKSASTISRRTCGDRVLDGEELRPAEREMPITSRRLITLPKPKAPDDEPQKQPAPLRILTFRGQSMPLNRWARVRGINASTLSDRIDNRWSVEDALTYPAMTRAQRKQVGERITYMLALYQASKSTHANSLPGGGSQLSAIPQGPAGAPSRDMGKN